MFTIYAIDCDGLQHDYAGGECATIEEALQGLEELACDGAMESEPDDLFFVR